MLYFEAFPTPVDAVITSVLQMEFGCILQIFLPKNDKDVGMEQDIIQNGIIFAHFYIPQAMIYNVTIILCGM